SDGNCGFRSLAAAIRENEENWILVKLAMRASPCSPSYWFLSPNCAQLAANTFSVPITIFDELNGQSMLFFPLDAPLRHRKNLIILHLINGNHIVYIDMKNYAKVSWPMVNSQHIPICRRYGLSNNSPDIRKLRAFKPKAALLENVKPREEEVEEKINQKIENGKLTHKQE
ncbi:21648_t:CDS:2, partial [Gigaspora margarita]